jgi:hypothetical protein
LANNFRLVGDYYVSKEGSDANSGLTPDLPKLTVQAGLNLIVATNKRLVIGVGVYLETITTPLLNGTSIVGDGLVIFQGNGTNMCTLQGANNSIVTFVNIQIRSYAILRMVVSGVGNTDFSGGECVLNNLILSGNSTNLNGLPAKPNIFINSQVSTLPVILCNYNIFINTQFINQTSNIAAVIFTNTYIDATSVITIPSSTVAASFNYNNIQGKIIMNTGTYSGIALSYADHRTQYPTFNVSSMSVAPLFNNVQNLDFTLQAASPHIRAASDFQTNIGGTEYAKHYEATSAEFTSGATITDLTLQADGYTITSPATEGRIITAPLAVQSYPGTKPLTGIIWNGSLEFNKSITGGLQGNQQVPAYDTYTSGAGATPDRLKIKMRYSTQSASPTAGQWDNGGYWTVDTYQLVEVNVKPKVDSNGIGNGDYTYIEFVGLGDIVPTWIQLDIKLRNDYNI